MIQTVGSASASVITSTPRRSDSVAPPSSLITSRVGIHHRRPGRSPAHDLRGRLVTNVLEAAPLEQPPAASARTTCRSRDPSTSLRPARRAGRRRSAGARDRPARRRRRRTSLPRPPLVRLRQDLEDDPDAPEDQKNTRLHFEDVWQTEPEVGSGVHVAVSYIADLDPWDRSVSCHCEVALIDTDSGGFLGIGTSSDVDQLEKRDIVIPADQTVDVLRDVDF